MKRSSITLIILTLFCLYTFPSFAAEQTESTIPPETTEPSEELPTEPVDSTTITFTYVDVETSEEIAPSKSVTGTPGTFVPVEVKAIPGYRVSEVMLVDKVDFLTKDFKFPITYEKLENPYEKKEDLPEEPTETTPSNDVAKTGDVEQPEDTSTETAKPNKDSEEKNEPVLAPKKSAEQQTAVSSSEKVEKDQETTPSNSVSKPTTSTKETKAANSAPAKPKKSLPKAGSQSQVTLTAIGLGFMTIGLLAYYRFKI